MKRRPYNWPGGEWRRMTNTEQLELSQSLVEQADRQRHTDYRGRQTLAQELAARLRTMALDRTP